VAEWTKVVWTNQRTYPPEHAHVEMRRFIVDRWLVVTGKTQRLDHNPYTTSVNGRQSWADPLDVGMLPDIDDKGPVDTIYWRLST